MNKSMAKFFFGILLVCGTGVAHAGVNRVVCFDGSGTKRFTYQTLGSSIMRGFFLPRQEDSYVKFNDDDLSDGVATGTIRDLKVIISEYPIGKIAILDSNNDQVAEFICRSEF